MKKSQSTRLSAMSVTMIGLAAIFTAAFRLHEIVGFVTVGVVTLTVGIGGFLRADELEKKEKESIAA